MIRRQIEGDRHGAGYERHVIGYDDVPLPSNSSKARGESFGDSHGLASIAPAILEWRRQQLPEESR